MRVLAGTSGFSYDEWKGPFYPADLPGADMLRFYAERLASVEVNNTFYRMPKSELMTRWAAEVPDGFVFVIKASRRITHQAQLVGTGELLGYLGRAIANLGPHLGPVLFQLPPWLRKDVPRLTGFLAELDPGMRAAFDFGHRSWLDDEVFEVLRGAGAAACFSDEEPGGTAGKRSKGTKKTSERAAATEASPGAGPQLVATADWGYLRLRRASYDDAALQDWAQRIRAQPWREAFVFFKHETGGAGPAMARRFAELFDGA